MKREVSYIMLDDKEIESILWNSRNMRGRNLKYYSNSEKSYLYIFQFNDYIKIGVGNKNRVLVIDRHFPESETVYVYEMESLEAALLENTLLTITEHLFAYEKVEYYKSKCECGIGEIRKLEALQIILPIIQERGLIPLSEPITAFKKYFSDKALERKLTGEHYHFSRYPERYEWLINQPDLRLFNNVDVQKETGANCFEYLNKVARLYNLNIKIIPCKVGLILFKDKTDDFIQSYILSKEEEIQGKNNLMLDINKSKGNIYLLKTKLYEEELRERILNFCVDKDEGYTVTTEDIINLKLTKNNNIKNIITRGKEVLLNFKSTSVSFVEYFDTFYKLPLQVTYKNKELLIKNNIEKE